jgi:hypothetical protein
VDQQSDTMKRMGETQHNKEGQPLDITVFARAIGDLEVKINVAKFEDEKTKESYTQVTVKYGFFGNCEQSQQLVSKISANLRRIK